jgi:predicted nuclease of predicted toxin-antitoxin system
MKVKLDENLPDSLAVALSGEGHDTDTIAEENLTGAGDPEVWSACLEEGRFLITQDLDFSDIRQFKPGTHPGIMIVRLRQPGRLALHERVLAAFGGVEADVLEGRFVVVTDHKIKIRQPES